MPRDPATPRRGTGQGPQTEGWAQRVAVALLGGPARQGTGTRADTVGSLPVIVFSPRKEGTANPLDSEDEPPNPIARGRSQAHKLARGASPVTRQVGLLGALAEEGAGEPLRFLNKSHFSSRILGLGMGTCLFGGHYSAHCRW